MNLADQIKSLAIEEQREIDAILRGTYPDPVVMHDGLKLPMHEGQLQAWNSTARYVACYKGWQAGGTLIGPPWLMREMIRRGPGDYAVITPNYPLMDNKARPVLLQTFQGLIRTSGNELHVTPKGSAFLWGDRRAKGRILLRHGDRPEAIEAFTAKAIWLDEPGQLDDEVWESIQARGAVHVARYLLTSRPYRRNWYVKELWDRCMRMDGENPVRKESAPSDTDCINFRSIDNPEFPKAEYEKQKARLPDWRFKMKYDGIPTKPAGAVFDTWITVPRKDPPFKSQRASGHDFGPLNTAAIFAFREGEGDDKFWTVYSEYLAGGKTEKEHVRDWIRDPITGRYRVATVWDEENIETPVIPWAWGGAHSNEQGWRSAFSANGYPIAEPRNVGVKKGIDILYGMLKTGQIRIMEGLERLTEELESYSYDVDDEGEPDEDKIVKKSTYHTVDCLRYLAVGLSNSGEMKSMRAGRMAEIVVSVDEHGLDIKVPKAFLNPVVGIVSTTRENKLGRTKRNDRT